MENSSSIKRVNRKYLTDNLWYEIFLRLTLDSIFKYRCVSKFWLSILTNPSFIKKWYKLNISLIPWGFVHNIVPKPEVDDPIIVQCAFPVLHSRYISNHGFSFRFLQQILDRNMYSCLIVSSNGLVLCRTTWNYYVCNPLTQKFVMLPPPLNDDGQILTGFICDNECFSGPTGYKVVLIPKFESPTKEFEVEMFSSDVGKWNIYDVSCPQEVTWECDSSDRNVTLTHDGVLYWLQKRNNKTLAVRGNECRLIDMPYQELEVNGDSFEFLNQSLGESEGSICLVRFNNKEANLSVWMLDGDQWNILQKDIKLHDQFAEIESQLIDGTGVEDLIQDIAVNGFSPVDKNVVMLCSDKYAWAFNTKTRLYEQLLHPPFLPENLHCGRSLRTREFVIKLRPTVLPPISWNDRSNLNARFRVDNSGVRVARFL